MVKKLKILVYPVREFSCDTVDKTRK